MAAILVSEKGIADPDQAYIMSEVVRYLDNDSSGVEAFSRMPQSWKDLCVAIQNDATIKQKPSVLSCVIRAAKTLLFTVILHHA
jgi:hypothetical protein